MVNNNTIKKITPILNWDYVAEDPVFKDILKRNFEELLVTSDLLVLKRLNDIEIVLELNGWKELYGKEITGITIPELLFRINKKINAITLQEASL
jgi:hypothetical protein